MDERSRTCILFPPHITSLQISVISQLKAGSLLSEPELLSKALHGTPSWDVLRIVVEASLDQPQPQRFGLFQNGNLQAVSE